MHVRVAAACLRGALWLTKRTGLLWALEGLAWNPETFPRVVKALGRLAEVKISNNWANKPIGSLGSIFRAMDAADGC